MDETKSQLDWLSLKKAYRKPRLYVYGDIRMITQANAVPGGVADGNNKGSIHKTA
jgi:hypothetical protein